MFLDPSRTALKSLSIALKLRDHPHAVPCYTCAEQRVKCTQQCARTAPDSQEKRRIFFGVPVASCVTRVSENTESLEQREPVLGHFALEPGTIRKFHHMLYDLWQ